MSYNDAPPRPSSRPQPGPNVRAPYRSTARHAARRLPAYVYWRRRALVVLGAITLMMFSYYGITLALALNNPSYGAGLQARMAEWGRQHGFGAIVTWAETEYNKMHPAKVGGNANTGQIGTGTVNVKVTATQPLPPPKNIKSPSALPFPGEGVWKPAGRFTANGIPGVYETFLQPDAIHTSYIVGLAWMDPKVLSAQLYSGSQIPGGGPYTYTAPISAQASTSVVSVFNAGFRMGDANGGYYTDNKMVIPLRPGGASAIIYKDGTMSVGMWGRDFHMTPQVASVRQNLNLIVDGGKAVPGLANPNAIAWGKTLGGTFNVWRSGLGVTANGALVYVGGPALSINDLAATLVRAGAVRGMELDINSDWVDYGTFTGPLGQPINGSNGTNLLSTMTYTPAHFFASWWRRDFFVMSIRPKYMNASTAAAASKG